MANQTEISGISSLDILRKNLKRLRKLHHETQIEAALEIGISEAHLRNIETGAANPSIAVLDKLAAHYSMQTAQLLMLQPNDAVFPDPHNALDPQTFTPPCMRCPLLKWLKEQGKTSNEPPALARQK